MTSTTQRQNECGAQLNSWIKLGQQPETSTCDTHRKVVTIDFSISAASRTRPGSLTPDQLVAQLSRGVAGEKRLAEARKWVADKLGVDGHVTLRMLRLRRNLSQKQLADLLNTSQPHIARIEAGKDNIHLDTMRKLARALDVDANTIDTAIGFSDGQECGYSA